MKRVLAAALAALAVYGHVSRACEYKAFDLKIKAKDGGIRTRGSRGAGDEEDTKKTPLKFAVKVAADATMVHSDAPFIRIVHGEKRMTWKLDPTDTKLASQNTMLEFFGYFKDYLGVTVPDSFLTMGSMKKMEGLSIVDFMHYPEGDRADELATAVKSVFGGAGAGILTKMKEKNGDVQKFGMQHFSRPAYLSSPGVLKEFGDATVLACMSLAYSVDLYTNPVALKPENKEAMKLLGVSAVRTSILDRMAAEAIGAKAKDKDPGSVTVKLSGGKVSCSLKKSTQFSLEPAIRMRCPSVVQSDPVVRGGPEGYSDDRFIQVGEDLYTTECTFGDKKVDMQTSEALAAVNFGDFLTALGSGLDSSPLGKKIKENIATLRRPGDKSKEFVMEASKECDALVTGAGKKVGAAPAFGHGHGTEAVVQAPAGTHGGTTL